MSLAEIKRLWKRCDHFCGKQQTQREMPWGLDTDMIEPKGMGVAALNYALMQSIHDTALDRLAWAGSLAKSFNRYIDNNRIDGDLNALRCLRWWRAQLFLDPGKL